MLVYQRVERKSLGKQNLCDLPPAFSNENLTSRYCMVLPELPRENFSASNIHWGKLRGRCEACISCHGGWKLCPGSRISLFFGLPQMFEGNDSIRSLFLIRPRCSIPGTSGIPNFCAMWVPQFERLKANRLCHSTRWLNQRGTEKYFKPMAL